MRYEASVDIRVESSRDPERKVMVWPGMPIGLSRDQARNLFDAHVKPRQYVVDRFYYNPRTGRTETIGQNTQ
jgi:hypothetical protein